jgi:hypothetical protein
MGSYFRGLAENTLRESRANAIKAAAQTIEYAQAHQPNKEDKAHELSIEKKASLLQDCSEKLSASLLMAKRNVILETHKYLLSLQYRSSRYAYLETKISPSMEFDELQKEVVNLHKKVKEKYDDGKPEVEYPPIHFLTDEKTENIFPLEWISWLIQFGEIPFKIPSSNSKLGEYYDSRVTNIR